MRGEFSIASIIRPLKVSNFSTLDDLRKLIIEQVDMSLEGNNEGRIVQYSPTAKDKSLNFVRLSTGSLGGKARGLAFAINLLSESKINKKYNNIKLRVPKVAVIGTDDFDHFVQLQYPLKYKQPLNLFLKNSQKHCPSILLR